MKYEEAKVGAPVMFGKTKGKILSIGKMHLQRPLNLHTLKGEGEYTSDFSIRVEYT